MGATHPARRHRRREWEPTRNRLHYVHEACARRVPTGDRRRCRGPQSWAVPGCAPFVPSTCHDPPLCLRSSVTPTARPLPVLPPLAHPTGSCREARGAGRPARYTTAMTDQHPPSKRRRGGRYPPRSGAIGGLPRGDLWCAARRANRGGRQPRPAVRARGRIRNSRRRRTRRRLSRQNRNGAFRRRHPTGGGRALIPIVSPPADTEGAVRGWPQRGAWPPPPTEIVRDSPQPPPPPFGVAACLLLIWAVGGDCPRAGLWGAAATVESDVWGPMGRTEIDQARTCQRTGPWAWIRWAHRHADAVVDSGRT